MKRDLSKLALLMLCALVGALLFAWSGLYNVGATAGHWPVTAWFLHYAMRNSVEMHALPLQAPPLDDLALVERGAGHYDTGCAPCHGAPGAPGNRIPSNMLPEPPYLPGSVGPWSPEELFWLVKHGLKYTGMPGWPAQTRDDEVWAVTAFLLQLPDLSPDEYAALARGAAAPLQENVPLPETPGQLFTMSGAALIGACVRCHGTDGVGRESGAFPRLDIQTPDYLAHALAEYATGLRPSGIMQPVAAALAEGEIDRLARHFGQAPSPPPVAAPEPAAAAADSGEQIAVLGNPDRRVPACSACHGLGEGPVNPLFPALAGQYAGQIALQLTLWKEGKRGEGGYAAIMQPIAERLTAEEIEAVAHYYAGLRPAGGESRAMTAQ